MPTDLLKKGVTRSSSPALSKFRWTLIFCPLLLMSTQLPPFGGTTARKLTWLLSFCLCPFGVKARGGGGNLLPWRVDGPWYSSSWSSHSTRFWGAPERLVFSANTLSQMLNVGVRNRRSEVPRHLCEWTNTSPHPLRASP